MSKRAAFEVIVGGAFLGSILSPRLISLTVSDKVGTHTDTAQITIDDTDGRVSLPQIGAAISILLGWDGSGIRQVFTGTVDEIRSSGSRGSGRTLSISAKGIDTLSKAKEPQHRHFDQMTVEDVLTQAGQYAGIGSVRVDPALASIMREYVEMHDESFIHLGERIAREVGGNFTIRGTEAILSLRAAPYTAFVRAVWGENLHQWDIRPDMGRPAFSAAGARWYDMAAAAWRTIKGQTPLPALAEFWNRWPKPDEQEATTQTESDAATTERDAAEGSVSIEGNTEAVPDGLCILSGTRPGVDGPYRIEAVTHSLSRGAGFVTKLELKRATKPEAEAEGSAAAPAAAAPAAEVESSAPPYLDPDAEGPQ